MRKNDFWITFKLRTTPGRSVQLTADFLKWSSVLMLDSDGDGTYLYKAKLPPGDYLYQYQVDGQVFDDPFCREFKINEKTGEKYNIKHVFDSKPNELSIIFSLQKYQYTDSTAYFLKKY